ncbi:MAG: insulinase family protein [Gomphosphaeria aponina SAG 52.96 = DSM 107014]|uniref:Insulinase family protein n=1 Tax=Gomphosphaeria aponina SAG 52.96 = DSM 107014 TaxID=1521640 RepID=A0A941JSS6_9CHRO|nr:insulinase family protein [Gomphosphaeria aponina SAG 52.96 = DSM 107014]
MQLINKKNPGWLGLLLITLLLVLLLRNRAMASGARHFTELEFPPLPEIQLPEYERYQLPNGMVVYLMEDHELPLVSGSAIIRTGSRLEPPHQVGLAELTGTVMRSGGTLEHPAAELNEMLEQRAAIVETSIDTTSGNAGFNTLSEDLPTVFNLFAEVLRSPAFAEEQLLLAKTQLQGQIARRNDDPGDIASREFSKLIYGNTSPYGRTVEYTTLANISRADVIDFYQSYFRPDGIILGIVGDFESTKMKELIAQTFADWQPPSRTIIEELVSPSQENLGGIFFVEQPQLTQSNILLGHLGGQLDNPDYPALSVLNGVLNGFGGRLFKEVRSRQGLAYSVYGFWSPSYDYPGLFIAGGQTRSEATVAFVQSILTEIDKLRTTPITPEELAYAQEKTLNSFVFNFEQPSQTLSRLMGYEYFGYPADFIFQYQRGVKATTIEDIQRVAQQYLNPEQIVTLVVGNANEIKPPLTHLNPDVKLVDISIPEPQKS